MGDKFSSWQRVRHHPPESRWRDPDFLAVFQYFAMVLGVALLIAGSFQIYQFLTTEADPANRYASCRVTTECVDEERVFIMGAKGNEVTVRTMDTQDIVVERIGGAGPASFNIRDEIVLESWHDGQYIAVVDRTSGAVMQLKGYPPPPAAHWWPEVSAGLLLTSAGVGLIFWRRRLYASQTVLS